MVSPKTIGIYQSDWKLQNVKGESFGIGKNRTTPFWVKIVVGTPMEHTGKIDGFVWQDQDRDNIVDSNELLANVMVSLATGSTCHVLVSNTQTDGNGRFAFSHLAAGNYCIRGMDGNTVMTQIEFSLNANQHLSNVQVSWPPTWAQQTTIWGHVYEDSNENGRYDSGERLLPSRQVGIFPGDNCHVGAPFAGVTFSDASGRYALAGEFEGDYCVGLPTENGFEDVRTITVVRGQTVTNLYLKAPLQNGTVSGWVWDDYCEVDDAGHVVGGNCVPDGSGSYRADSAIQPTEAYISGVTIQLQSGICIEDNPKTTAVTDANGRYLFDRLLPGIYCVSVNAAQNGNPAILLTGEWTFPDPGVWYHEIYVGGGQPIAPVNFGWDFE